MCGSKGSSAPAKPVPPDPGLKVTDLNVPPDPSKAYLYQGREADPNTTGRYGSALMVGNDQAVNDAKQNKKTLLG